MKNTLIVLLSLAGIVAGTSTGLAASGIYEGEILINKKYVTVAGKDFKLSSKTECRDQTGTKTTCETLAQVGYADRARITVSDDAVTRVDVLKLSQ